MDELSEKLFKDAPSFESISDNVIFKSFSKIIIHIFLDVEMVTLFNIADDDIDNCKYLRRNKLERWKENDSYKKYVNNETINEIVKEELFQMDSDNVQDVFNSRLRCYQLSMSLLIPKWKSRINHPFFRAICIVALIIDDVTDMHEDYQKDIKTLFTMLPHDKAYANARKVLLDVYEDIKRGPGTTELDYIDLMAQTLLQERNLLPLKSAEIFWLLAIYRINNMGMDTKIPFDLSSFLRSVSY